MRALWWCFLQVFFGKLSSWNSDRTKELKKKKKKGNNQKFPLEFLVLADVKEPRKGPGF
jgi:hypothetical protein